MMRKSHGTVVLTVVSLMMCVVGLSVVAIGQTPRPALLVLDKDDSKLAIVDPASLKVVARVPAGDDPHEVVVSDDGTARIRKQLWRIR